MRQWLHVIGVGIWGILMVAAAPAQDRQDWRVTVTGEGTVNVAPDMADVRVGVVSQAKTAREASDANSKAMAAAIAALKDSGIAAEDIQTSRLFIYPVSDSARGAQRIAGFRASNQVTARIRDLARLGGVLDRLIDAGANEVSGIDFIVSNRTKALDAARAEAIADARRKAEIYARAAGLGVGRVVYIEEEGAGGPPPVRAAAVRAAAPMPIEPGLETLRVAVRVSFELVR